MINIFERRNETSILTIIILGFDMALVKVAVYKHIPVYCPHNVVAFGDPVGMIGRLNGFILPILFSFLLDFTGIYTTWFMILFIIAAVSIMWLHFSIRLMEKNQLK